MSTVRLPCHHTEQCLFEVCVCGRAPAFTLCVSHTTQMRRTVWLAVFAMLHTQFYAYTAEMQYCGTTVRHSFPLSHTHSICPSLFCIDDKIVLMIYGLVCLVHVCVRDRFAPILNTNMHFR